MIQRIQTVYYVIALLLAALPLLELPLITFLENGDLMKITAYGNELVQIRSANTETTIFESTQVFLGNVLIMVLLLVTIISFRNLKRQVLLGRITLVVYLLAIGLVFFAALSERAHCTACEVTGISPAIPLYVFALGILFIFLGNRGVRKDKKLLESLNRLR